MITKGIHCLSITELVEEVLRRLEENDLFVKPEKCQWKVKEMEFLGMVIGPREVEIQKKKVDGVLSWLVPRNIKSTKVSRACKLLQAIY